VGTSSPRRAAQLLRLRPDLRIAMLRGNVDTRLAKVGSEVDATLLAAAGLDRLGRDAGTPIPIETMLPAPAQGAVGVEARADDDSALRLLAAIDHPATRACVLAERGLLAVLEADCHSPVGALATIEGAILTLRAELLSGDGRHHVHAQEAGDPGDPELPRAMARDLLERAPPEVRRLFGG
jgi:hydroxymethylbilane synthase